jgi:hypothetical protein
MAAEPATQEAPAAAAPAPAKPAKAPKAPKAAKKEAKGGKAKGGNAAKGGEGDASVPSVAAHPRAARGVARAKGWGALIGFALGGYLSLPTNTVAEAGLRALLAGMVCYVAAWAGAVFVWRRVVVLELKGREQELVEAAVAASAAREQSAAAGRQANARAAS